MQLKMMCPSRNINCRIFSCDWETVISKSFKEHFPGARFVGCFFHFKQALRRKLLNECDFKPKDITFAMSMGVIDLLCVIPHAEVVKYGIPFVRSLIEDGLDKNDIERWDHFWAYFIRQWVNRTGIHKWSIVDVDGFLVDLINRTNNTLGNYNRFFDNLFPSKPVRISTTIS